jgi:glycosyltransferase involved in cell wall biosynthesis
LIIVGDGEESINIKKEIDRLRINNYVKLLGFVDEDKLISYYHAADLFVYPSKYEGFGYTPLEAMACGVPVLTSNTSSIPEVAGEAAMTVDPHNLDELRTKMEQILDDKDLSNKMIIEGLKQAKIFSWEICARQTLEIYRSLI